MKNNDTTIVLTMDIANKMLKQAKKSGFVKGYLTCMGVAYVSKKIEKKIFKKHGAKIKKFCDDAEKILDGKKKPEAKQNETKPIHIYEEEEVRECLTCRHQMCRDNAEPCCSCDCFSNYEEITLRD